MSIQITATCSRCCADVTFEVDPNTSFQQILNYLRDKHRAIPELNWNGCQTEIPRGKWFLMVYGSPGPEIVGYRPGSSAQGVEG